MVRGDNANNHVAFPSKLTEYLSTSIPVITVNVGEISNYLTNNYNSFLIKPNNHVELVEKLDFILQNYEYALQIAQRGKDLTYNIFNYKRQTERMLHFIRSN